jgi:hypothetical protein
MPSFGRAEKTLAGYDAAQSYLNMYLVPHHFPKFDELEEEHIEGY